MKIIQTFWTAGQDPLKHGFGWTHPEYNLMSWALSCLSLREHYDEVELYTDSAGYHILIEVLQLPYTKTHVIFDDFQCLPHHWALSKIKTYSLQTEPFLHIDGDIYLPHPLPERVLNAPLVAQNREIGTSYYRRMMDAFLKHQNISISGFLRKRWEEQSISSYNMGVFGGKDLDFIHRYCLEVEDFIGQNHLNDANDCRSCANANVIFEQMLFATLVEKEERTIQPILEEAIEDTGYTASKFCDIKLWQEKDFFHIVGGNKRVHDTFIAIEQKLFSSHFEYFRRIALLFPEKHPYMGTTLEKAFVEQTQKTLTGESFARQSLDDVPHQRYTRNAMLRILPNTHEGNTRTAYLPSIFSCGGKRFTVEPLGMNILHLLDGKESTMEDLCHSLYPCFTPNMSKMAETWIEKEMHYLLHHGAIIIF